ncbi:MAG: hypothetical protein AAF849_07030 [Bacteroidota bacterium]
MQLSININEDKKGIEVRFDEKPSDHLTSLLGNLGFRYSYKQNMWYASHTPQRLSFADQLKIRLEAAQSLDDLLIQPTHEASLQNIDLRNFSCISITCSDADDDEHCIVEEFLLFEPAKKAAEELSRRFAAALYGDRVQRVIAIPRSQKKKARALWEQGRIIYASIPEVKQGEEKIREQYALEETDIEELENTNENDTLDRYEDTEITHQANVDLGEVSLTDASMEDAPIEVEVSEEPLFESPSQQDTDESILEELYQMNRRLNLSRSFLQSLGIQHSLNSWSVLIGNYQLKRASVFRFTFNLTAISDSITN